MKQWIRTPIAAAIAALALGGTAYAQNEVSESVNLGASGEARNDGSAPSGELRSPLGDAPLGDAPLGGETDADGQTPLDSGGNAINNRVLSRTPGGDSDDTEDEEDDATAANPTGALPGLENSELSSSPDGDSLKADGNLDGEARPGENGGSGALSGGATVETPQGSISGSGSGDGNVNVGEDGGSFDADTELRGTARSNEGGDSEGDTEQEFEEVADDTAEEGEEASDETSETFGGGD